MRTLLTLLRCAVLGHKPLRFHSSFYVACSRRGCDAVGRLDA